VTLVVEAGQLVDVLAGEVLPDRRVVVDGERVSAVLGPNDPAPVGAEVLDLRDCTVLPGLIDLHTHLVGPVEAGDAPGILDRSPAEEALDGVANARATLGAGVTTVRDVGTFWAFVDIDLRRAIDTGVVEGPRMQCAGAYLTCSGGGGEITGVPHGRVVPPQMRVGVADSVDDVRRAAERIVAAGATVLKVIATGAVLAPGTEPGEAELSEAQIRAAVEVAAAHGLYVAAHAHGAEGAKRAARAGVRSIEHGSLLDDEALDLMGEHGTWLVADVYNGDYIEETGVREGWPAELLRKNRETTGTQREAFSKAVERGLNIAFGTDAGVYPHGANARQLPIMVRLGLAPLATLRAATADAARCMGWEHDVGALEPGRYADLVAVRGFDLGDLTLLQEPQLVVKGGVTVADRRGVAPAP
jgi:imidazolonepropionase-like amidohydrolase